MPPTLHELGIEHLSVEDRLALAEAIWESVATELAARDITPAERAELDRRIALADADPRRGIPWESVLAAARSRSIP